MKRFAVVMFFCLVIAGVNAQEQKNDLWVLAVGINEYPKNQVFASLKFGVSDAKKICDLFKAQEGKAFNKVNTLLIADTEAIRPVKNNILSNLSFFRNAKPNDTVILYFSSHSTLQDGNLYLLPSDFKSEKGEKIVVSSGINFNDIVQNFNTPGKKIIILDTHYSETAGRLAADKNIAVFGACKDDEQAYESLLYEGGFFTTSIVNGFKATDGKITLISLFHYVRNRVGEISRNRQNPVLVAPSGMGDVVLGIGE